ncbi:MAG TPA: hypothetical protein VK506_05760 [Conexibacter sp.]|nr:hypothetical protein [Conexibacter sp.]
MKQLLLAIALVLAPALVEAQGQRTMFVTTGMLTAQATTTSSQAFKPATGSTTFEAYGLTTAGAGAATVIIEVSNVENPTVDTEWITAGTITLTLGTTQTADGFAMYAAWRNVRARLSAISGTGATVNVRMGNGQ